VSSVGWAVTDTDHAFEHRRERLLVAAEADEDRPVPEQRSIGDVPPEDLPEVVLIGPRDVRGRGSRIELEAVGLAAADDRLLVCDG
jgi:hypothetical protein